MSYNTRKLEDMSDSYVNVVRCAVNNFFSDSNYMTMEKLDRVRGAHYNKGDFYETWFMRDDKTGRVIIIHIPFNKELQMPRCCVVEWISNEAVSILPFEL